MPNKHKPPKWSEQKSLLVTHSACFYARSRGWTLYVDVWKPYAGRGGAIKAHCHRTSPDNPGQADMPNCPYAFASVGHAMAACEHYAAHGQWPVEVPKAHTYQGRT